MIKLKFGTVPLHDFSLTTELNKRVRVCVCVFVREEESIYNECVVHQTGFIASLTGFMLHV